MILFRARAIFASSITKFEKFFPETDRDDFNSSSESTISTSLIHNVASEGKHNWQSLDFGFVFSKPKITGNVRKFHFNSILYLEIHLNHSCNSLVYLCSELLYRIMTFSAILVFFNSPISRILPI